MRSEAPRYHRLPLSMPRPTTPDLPQCLERFQGSQGSQGTEERSGGLCRAKIKLDNYDQLQII